MTVSRSSSTSLGRDTFLHVDLTDSQKVLVRDYGTESCQVAKYIIDNPSSLKTDEEVTREDSENNQKSGKVVGLFLGISAAPLVGIFTAEAAKIGGLTAVGVGLGTGGTVAASIAVGVVGAVAIVACINVGRRVVRMEETEAFRQWKLVRDQTIKDRALSAMIKTDEVLKDFLCPISGEFPLIPIRRKNDSNTEATFDLESLKQYATDHPGSGYYRGEPAFEIEDGVVKGVEIDYPHLNTIICRLGKINERLKLLTFAAKRAFIEYNKRMIEERTIISEKVKKSYTKETIPETPTETIPETPPEKEMERKGSVEDGEDLMFQLSGIEQDQKEKTYYSPHDSSLMKQYVYDSWECTLAVKKKLRINPHKRTFTFVKTHSLSLDSFERSEREM